MKNIKLLGSAMLVSLALFSQSSLANWCVIINTTTSFLY